MSENIVWIRGELLPESCANVNILSGMAQFGLNVFEGIRSYASSVNGKLYTFRLMDHILRLQDSCKLVGFELPDEPNTLIDNYNKTLRANKFSSDVAVRLTVFADGKGSWHATSPISYFIAPMLKPRTNVDSLVGMRACVSSWSRISDNVMPPRAKIGANYINGRFAHLAATSTGHDLPILLNQYGDVAEGAGSCIFLVKRGRLITPDITSSILESITRDTIITLAKNEGFQVEERRVDRTELYLADEIFCCGTAAEITPIISVDQYPVGTGSVGVVTKLLLTKYHATVSGENIVRHSWLTEVV